jgi:NAD(P)-dependent dehydrogenase (short-subunit alcohol dehydrogenase family)
MKNKIAVVTCASKYAGPGIVSELLKADYTVVCHDKAFVNENEKMKFENQYPGVYLNSSKDPATLVTTVLKQFNQIDLLVSNDVQPLKYLHLDEADAADMRETVEALLVWPFCLLGKVAAKMKKQGKGYIVLITSAAPLQPEVGFSIYSSVRAGCTALARAAAKELASYNITVNAIAPNYLESEIYYPSQFWSTPENSQKLKKAVPVGRLGKAKEVGALVAFLASGSVDFITGEVIHFTGGWP